MEKEINLDEVSEKLESIFDRDSIKTDAMDEVISLATRVPICSRPATLFRNISL